MIGIRVLAVLLPAVALLSCVAPEVTAEQYRARVQQAVESMTGIVVTARDTARLDVDGKLPRPVVVTVVGDAEQDADSVRSDVESRQPPDEASDDLRRQVTGVVEHATSLITDLRIAIRRGDQTDVRALADALSAPLDGLQALR